MDGFKSTEIKNLFGEWMLRMMGRDAEYKIELSLTIMIEK